MLKPGKFLIVNKMRLRGKDALRFLLGHILWQCSMRGGNVLGDVGHHGNAPVDVVVKQIGAQLRIQNLPCQDDESQYQEYGNDRDEEVSNDQAVAETPEQPRRATIPANRNTT